MLGNNISNHSAPYVGFDVDSLAFIEKKEGMIQNFLDKFKTHESRYLSREVSLDFINTMEQLWRKHNICIIFITFSFDQSNVKELYDKFSEVNIPFTRIMQFQEWDNLRRSMGNFLYVFSGNEELISYLSAKHALNYAQVREVL